MNKKELPESHCPFFGHGDEMNDYGHCWNKNGEPCIQKCNGLLADDKTPCAYRAGMEWQAKTSPWISVEDGYPDYDKDVPLHRRQRFLVRVISGSAETNITYTLGWLTSRYRFNVEMDWVKVTHYMPIPLCTI